MRVLPLPDERTAFYWEGARHGELRILRCRACRAFHHPPRAACPACGAADLAPERVSGRGRIHTYTIAHRDVPGHETPFPLVLVELDEQPGLRLLANLVECPLVEVRIGMPVEVTFQPVDGGVTLPQFRPSRSGASEPLAEGRSAIGRRSS